MKELNYEEIAQKVKERRISLGYSYSELSELSGISKSTLQRYESGHIKGIPIARLKALSTALDMEPNELIGVEQENSPASEKSTVEWLEDLLVKKRWIRRGQDITPAQAKFLIGVATMLEAFWDAQNEQ